jgi:hypothetical protein
MLGFSSVRLCLISAAVVLAPAATSAAEPFPSKMLRIIVPYAPGGSIDLVARVLAKNIQDSVGQTVIVENKPGAGGALGMDALVRSPADGHTVAIVSDSPITINPHLTKLNYDPLVDLVPVTKVVSSPILLGVNPKAGINSIADLVAASKAKAGGLSYAVSYRGSTSYLAGELLQRDLGIKMQARPRRSPSSPARCRWAWSIRQRSCRWSGTARCARSASPTRSARRLCPTSRPWRRPAFPVSAPPRGLRCSRRAARRPITWPGSAPRSPRS